MNVVRILLNYYSSWYKLKKAVAAYRRLCDILKSKKREKYEPFNTDDLKDAENAILHYVQREAFKKDAFLLQKDDGAQKQLPKNSKIYQLNPFLDKETGLLRVGRRLNRANVEGAMRQPVLLPRKGHITNFMIR